MVFPYLYYKSYGIRLLLTDSGLGLIPVSIFERSMKEQEKIAEHLSSMSDTSFCGILWRVFRAWPLLHSRPSALTGKGSVE